MKRCFGCFSSHSSTENHTDSPQPCLPITHSTAASVYTAPKDTCCAAETDTRSDTFFDARESLSDDASVVYTDCEDQHLHQTDQQLHSEREEEVVISYKMGIRNKSSLPQLSTEYLDQVLRIRSEVAKRVQHDTLIPSSDGSNSSDSSVPLDVHEQTSIAKLLSRLKPNTDLTRMQLPAQFLQPFSVLAKTEEAGALEGSIRGWDASLLTANSPLQRLKGVLCLHLDARSITKDIVAMRDSKDAAFMSQSMLAKPLNPCLGETHRWQAGNVQVICEQVSHHPPQTAMHVRHSGALNFCSDAVLTPNVRFEGGCVRVKFSSSQELSLFQRDGSADTFWIDGMPGLCCNDADIELVLMPYVYLQLRGTVVITRMSTGERAVLTYRPRGRAGLQKMANRVICQLYDREGNLVEELQGRFDTELSSDADGEVLWRCPTSASSVDTSADTATNKYGSDDDNSEIEVQIIPWHQYVFTDSAIVWSEFAKALASGDMKAASRAKRHVESAQRAFRQAIGASKAGRRDDQLFHPQLFHRDNSGMTRLKSEAEIKAKPPQHELQNVFARKLYAQSALRA